MGFDLNKASGFQALVGGTGIASTLLDSLTGAISQTWDIQESSYGHDGKQILFHIFKTAVDFNAAVDNVQDTGGHRKIPIVFPYKDGGSTDDLGREAEVFDFNVVLHGPNYKAQYVKLLRELDKPTPGVLVHPVRGQITVVAKDWITVHKSESSQAVTMRIRFLEHSFSVDYSTIPNAQNVPSALTTALGYVAKVSNIITTVQSLEFVAIGTKNLVAALIGGYLSGFNNVLGQLNTTFNGGDSAAIPGLAPTVAGQDPSVFGVATSPNNAFSGTGTVVDAQSTQLTAALASQQAIDSVGALRTSLEDAIRTIEATEDGQGSLIFYDEVLVMKQSAISMQSVLELGLQTSKNKVVTYMTPREMSVREVCFTNGLSPDNSYDLEVLNPSLLSLNAIPKGTIIQVPV